MKTIKPFYVINHEFNTDKFINYDVMPYFVNCYNKVKKKEGCPKTFEDFKKFIEEKSHYMYWARCEYEILISDWPNNRKLKKIDIHYQIMMNIDVITNLLMDNVL